MMQTFRKISKQQFQPPLLGPAIRLLLVPHKGETDKLGIRDAHVPGGLQHAHCDADFVQASASAVDVLSQSTTPGERLP